MRVQVPPGAPKFMKTSAGLILTNGIVLLGCHSTNNSFWDLPKGEIRENEDPLKTCIRETKEETDLDIPSTTTYPIKDMGVFDYIKSKKLHLFALNIPILPPVRYMKCNSTFEMHGKTYPEVDDFKYIKFEEINEYFTPNMVNVLDKILHGI